MRSRRTVLPADPQGAAIVSYCTENEDYNTSTAEANEFTVMARGGGDLDIYINGEAISAPNLSGVLFDGVDHRLSISWDGATGAIKVYVNGAEVFSGTHQQGATLSAGGTLMFGQEQDVVGGAFQSSQIFRGTMDDIRLFSDVRTAQEIADNADSALADPASEQGLVSNWQINAGGAGIVDEAGGDDLTLNGGATLIPAGDVYGSGAVVASVASVSDVDAGDSFTFALTDDAGGKYQIDPATGEISLTADHDVAAAASDVVTV